MLNKDIEIKKCVEEIIDELNGRKGFNHVFDSLDEDIEEEITDKLEEIVKRRFEKYHDSTGLNK